MGRSIKVTKEGAASEHLSAGGRNLVRDANVNILSSLRTAVASTENLNHLYGDYSAIVNGDPGCIFPAGVTQFVILHITKL